MDKEIYLYINVNIPTRFCKIATIPMRMFVDQTSFFIKRSASYTGTCKLRIKSHSQIPNYRGMEKGACMGFKEQTKYSCLNAR